MQGEWVQSLVGKLRSHMPVAKKQDIKQKHCCNKFNKDFKKKKSLLLSQLVPLSPSHTVYTSLFSISASPFCSVTQSCLTLCDPMDCNLPGSSVLGISQARILEWVTISFSRGSSTPRDRTSVSCTGRQILHH